MKPDKCFLCAQHCLPFESEFDHMTYFCQQDMSTGDVEEAEKMLMYWGLPSLAAGNPATTL